MSEPKSPEVHIALNLLAELGDEDPALRRQLRRLLPALAQDYARAGKPVSERSLRQALLLAIEENRPLASLFHETRPPRTRNRLKYSEVGRRLNTLLHPHHRWTLHDQLSFGNVGAIEAALLHEPLVEEFLHQNIEVPARHGHYPLVRFMLLASVQPEELITKAVKGATYATYMQQYHVLSGLEREFGGVYGKVIETAIQVHSKSEGRAGYEQYKKYRDRCQKDVFYPDEALNGLESRQHMKVRMDEYIRVRRMLSFEIANMHTRNQDAFKAALIFQTAGRVLAYLDRWGKRGFNPLKTLIDDIRIPPDNAHINWKKWGDGLLAHGPQFAELTVFAGEVPEPVTNALGNISFKATQHHIWRTCYPHKNENLPLAQLAMTFARPNNIFEKALNIWRSRADQDPPPAVAIPDITITGEDFGMPGYTLCRIDYDDPRMFFLGDYTGCCERIGYTFEETIEHAIQTRESGFYVLVDDKDNIRLHSWIWRGEGGQIIIDGYEAMDDNIHTDDLRALTRAIAVKLSDPRYADYEISDILLGQSSDQYRPQTFFPVARETAPRLFNEWWYKTPNQWLVKRLSPPDKYLLTETSGKDLKNQPY